MNVKKLQRGISVEEEVYKCPKCGEFELRPERVGVRKAFELWAMTGTWICDNPDCEVEYREDSQGELIKQ